MKKSSKTKGKKFKKKLEKLGQSYVLIQEKGLHWLLRGNINVIYLYKRS